MEDLIYSIYIFHKSGHLLFSEDINPRVETLSKKDNPDLISGLLSAISQFSESLGGKGVQRISMEEKYQIVGITSPKFNIRFVMMTDLTDDTGECHYFLRRCRQSFITKYREHLLNLKKKTLVKSDIFEDWGENLKTLSTDLDLMPIQQAMSGTIKELVNLTKGNHAEIKNNKKKEKEN